jgi:hypothetical protein
MRLRNALASLAWLFPAAAATQHLPIAVLPIDPDITLPATVNQAVELGNGRVAILGDFERVDRLAWNGLTMLGANGQRIQTFSPACGPSEPVTGRPAGCTGSLLALPDGGFVFTGNFSTFSGQPALRIARFDAHGNFLPAFNPFAGWSGYLAIAPLYVDGQWLVLNVNGVSNRRVDLSTGQLDPTVFPRASIKTRGGIQFSIWTDYSRTHIRRLLPDGGIDPAWTPGIPFMSGPVHYDPVTDRLFVVETGQWLGERPSVLRRLDPSASPAVETSWQLAAADSDLADLALGDPTLLTVDNGRLLALTSTGALVAASTITGQLLASRRGFPVTQGFPARNGGWLVSDRGNIASNGSALVRLDASLRPVPSFRSEIRQSGRVDAFAIAPDGRMVIGGSFDRVDGIRRNAVARFMPDFSLDLTWPSGGGLEFWPRWIPVDAQIAADGSTLIDESWAEIFGIPPPGPSSSLISPDGTSVGRIMRSHRPIINRITNDGFVVSGPGLCGTLLSRIPLRMFQAAFSSSWQICPQVAPWGPVPAEPTPFWFQTTLALDAQQTVYALVENQSVVTGQVPRLFRILNGSSLPDPAWGPAVRVSQFGQRVIEPFGDHVYIAIPAGDIDGVPVGPLIRINAADGRVDGSWRPNFDGATVVTALSFTDMQLTLSTRRIVGPQAELIASIDRRLLRDPGMRSRGLETYRVWTSGHPTRGWPRVATLDSDRSVVYGFFGGIDGLPRNGMAVIGSGAPNTRNDE